LEIEQHQQQLIIPQGILSNRPKPTNEMTGTIPRGLKNLKETRKMQIVSYAEQNLKTFNFHSEILKLVVPGTDGPQLTVT